MENDTIDKSKMIEIKSDKYDKRYNLMKKIVQLMKDIIELTTKENLI